MYLLKSQQNELFDMIIEIGLSPSLFEIESANDPRRFRDDEVTAFKARGSQYFFMFALYHSGQHAVEFSPGNHTISEYYKSGPTWEDQKQLFGNWLSYLKRELIQPDKWADMLKYGQSVALVLDSSEEWHFSDQEVQEIIAASEFAKARAALLLDLSNDQIKLIGERLDYICEKTKSLSKLDWKNIMAGALVGLMVDLSLSPQKASMLWEILREAFQRIILIALH